MVHGGVLFIATGFDVDDVEVYDTKPDPQLEDNLIRHLCTEVSSKTVNTASSCLF